MPWHKRTLWGAGVALVLVSFAALVALFIVMLQPRSSEASDVEASAAEDIEPAGRVPTVKTIRPRNDLPFVIEVRQPADVKAFYRADPASLVAGTVSRVPKAIGDSVRAGELLVEVDVPDRLQEVYEKAAVIQQRRSEFDRAVAQARVAAAAVRVADQAIKHRRAELVAAKAEEAYRKGELNRYKGLVRDKVVTRDLLSEKRKWHQAAAAATISAQVAIEKAKADWEEEKAKKEAAESDVMLKKRLVDVARRDRDRALALYNYAKITAPFDGVIIKRNVDPGDFVQNAASGQARPVMSVVRTDIMTILMKVPDSYAPYVTLGTEAIIQLPGRSIPAKVTRFSPSIHQQDRTMRVEVDLYNGSRQDYRRFVRKGLANFLAPVGVTNAFQATALLTAGRAAWGDNMKGLMDPFPVFPKKPRGVPGPQKRLLPGQYGYMKLILNEFADAYLIPNSAVFSVGGKTYILVVRNGKARRIPVRVEVNDARLAKVSLLVRKVTETGAIKVARALTGTEEIIASGQTEIEDGQKVETRPTDWAADPRLLRPMP
jgi:multidrug resistance efflux pump